MADCRHRRRGRDRGDRRRLGADVTLGRPYIDRIDRIALCATADAFALARDQAVPELISGRYSLALELCSTRSDVRILLPRFLDETSSIGCRKNRAAETTVGSGLVARARRARKSSLAPGRALFSPFVSPRDLQSQLFFRD
jgi:hypothetical protein